MQVQAYTLDPSSSSYRFAIYHACVYLHSNPLSAKFIKWSNTLKQIVGKLPTICLSMFDHFSGLAFKVLRCNFSDKVIENKVFLKYSKDGLLLISQSHNLLKNAWRKNFCLSGNCLCPELTNQYQSYVTFDAWQTFCLLINQMENCFP